MLTAYYWCEDAIRSRSVSDVVLTGVLDIPAPSARLIADWSKEISRLGLETGDVEPLPLARTRMNWPDYANCIKVMSGWMRTLGLQDTLASSDVALMACCGAKYHLDATYYGGAAFCNLFLSEDRGLDLHFAHTGYRIPLTRGTTVIFDTGQPHAVIQRRSGSFNAVDFTPDQDYNQVFLSWELPIEDINVARALGVVFDIDPLNGLEMNGGQVWLNGKRVNVYPDSGQWMKRIDHAGAPLSP